MKKDRFSDIEELKRRIQTESPQPGDYYYDYKLEEAAKDQQVLTDEEFHQKHKINFRDLPLSKQTLNYLSKRNFIKMTEIQRCSIPHALFGRDIIGSSKTGTGKTLAYVVPIIEALHRERFIPADGLGALILVPVRELAVQVFEVLNSLTEKREISLGLAIGGKSLAAQKQQLPFINILVATPGRLLQHLEETYGFQTNNLKILVLDEADAMLEMGFEKTIKAILSNLPGCQRMLFSATLNTSVDKLSQFALHSPERILLHHPRTQAPSSTQEQEKTKVEELYSIPNRLEQYYMTIEHGEKINIFYSFIKSHPRTKLIVFVTTCKQVRFLYEAFRKFKLGTPLYELHGSQKQNKRMAIYFTFLEKKHAILIATNVAARGLDFPKVDWVLQLDAPEDPQTYLHRVGRTARWQAQGKAMMLVANGEEKIIEKLAQAGLTLRNIKPNPQKQFNITGSLRSICSEHQDVKYLAQRAIANYLRFIHKAALKDVFSLSNIDLPKLASSYGLPNAPNVTLATQCDEQDAEQVNPQPKLSKIEKLRLKAKLKKQVAQTGEKNDKEVEEGEGESRNISSSDGLFRKKQLYSLEKSKPMLVVSRNQLKKIKPEGHFEGRNIIHFDEDQGVMDDKTYRVKRLREQNRIYEQKEAERIDSKIPGRLEAIHQRLLDNTEADHREELERRKVKRRKLKETRQRGILAGNTEELQVRIDDEQD